MTNEQATQLFDRYLEDTISQEEYICLRQWLTDERHETELDALITHTLTRLPDQGMADVDLDKMYAELHRGERVVSIKALPTRWRWVGIAAAIVLAVGVYFWQQQFLDPITSQLVKTVDNTQPILPGGNKATLTLADGSIIVLDSAENGALAQQGNSAIIKLNTGSLAYQSGKSNGELGYNTISTPKGGQYQIQLPDGSQVWLNAASSISFPTIFEKERSVIVTGEAYFEIVKDSKKPFTVAINNQAKVNVLGTSFNINAYENESGIYTTLIEGSVSFSFQQYSQATTTIRDRSGIGNKDFSTQNLVLQPGQQAQLIKNQSIIIKNIDLEKVTAWRNGIFNFEDTNLEEMMRQLERWYNIEVIYEKSIPNIKLKGEISREVPLNGLLAALKKLGLQYRLEGRKLLIQP